MSVAAVLSVAGGRSSGIAGADAMALAAGLLLVAWRIAQGRMASAVRSPWRSSPRWRRRRSCGSTTWCCC